MSGVVTVRLSGDRADVERVLGLLGEHYRTGLPTWKPNRDDPGERAYIAVSVGDDKT